MKLIKNSEDLIAIANSIDYEATRATLEALERWMNENDVDPTLLLMMAGHCLGTGCVCDDGDFEKILASAHNLIDWFAHDGRAHPKEKIAS
jgi:hypothetical protein